MLRVAVIADDITGAADTGIQFCRNKAPTYLMGKDHVRSFTFPESPHSLALFTNTRNLQPEQAAEELRATVPSIKALLPLHVYKKIDSCLRGNLGAELDALADTLGFDGSFVAPSLPGQGRTVLRDIHYLHGVPLAETEMALDPVSPVTESRVSVLLDRQSRHGIGWVSLDILEKSKEELVSHVRQLIRQRAKHIVFDAVTQDHLNTIADLALTHFPKSLMVGSAGFASSLAHLLFPGKAAEPDLPGPVGSRILFVCGSASEILRAQAEELVRSTRCSSCFLEPQDLISLSRGARIAELSKTAAMDLALRSVVIRIRPPAPSPFPGRGQEILKGLTELVVFIMNTVRPDGIFLSGGDTAFEIWKAIQAQALLLEQELLPGIVLGTLCGGSFDGLRVVVKAGAFGASDALLRIHEILTLGKCNIHGPKH